MPWLEPVPVGQRVQCIHDALSDRFTMAALCARYGISRRVGYQWLARSAEEGRRGLADGGRAPPHCPQRLGASIAERLCELWRAHPSWGARTLLAVLARRHPTITSWPAASTAAGATDECETPTPHRCVSDRIQHRTAPRAPAATPPASHYVTSARPYPDRLPALEYPGHFLSKNITTGGTLRFGTRWLYLANAMIDQTIGLEEVDDGQSLLYCNTVLPARFTEHADIIHG